MKFVSRVIIAALHVKTEGSEMLLRRTANRDKDTEHHKPLSYCVLMAV